MAALQKKIFILSAFQECWQYLQVKPQKLRKASLCLLTLLLLMGFLTLVSGCITAPGHYPIYSKSRCSALSRYPVTRNSDLHLECSTAESLTKKRTTPWQKPNDQPLLRKFLPLWEQEVLLLHKKDPQLETGHFWWGISTAPYQNEDKALSPDSPWYFKTDWDCFAEEGRVPVRGDNAVFSWSEFYRDVEAAKKLGVNHFRFGIEWARIEPQPGKFNQKAVDHYLEMIDQLKAAGIEPVVTLWHFTFPSWLYDKKHHQHSNFAHPKVEKAWSDYLEYLIPQIAPKVQIYVPQNEPNGALQLGWIAAHWPPGLLLHPFGYKKAMQTAARMFRSAAIIIKRERKDAIIMGIYSFPECRRSHLNDPGGIIYYTYQHQNYDHLDMVADVCDIIGVNYYYSKNSSLKDLLIRLDSELSSQYTQMGWKIAPEGLYRVLWAVYHRYHKPLVITENGVATQSGQKAIAYFRNHIAQMRRAINDGIDVRGYFPWTLVDNYEWTEGWSSQFGLFAYEKKNHHRHITPAGSWFQKFIQAYPQP